MQKKIFFLFLIILILSGIIFFMQAAPSGNIALSSGCAFLKEEVFFCPQEKCSEQLISKIDSAQKSIHVAIYSFTLDEIALALIEAKNRGLEVKVLLEKQQSGTAYSEEKRLASSGIETRFMDNPEGIMHDKFSVFDSQIAATGSFNYTANANSNNNENLIFLHNPETVREFEEEFARLWNSS